MSLISCHSRQRHFGGCICGILAPIHLTSADQNGSFQLISDQAVDGQLTELGVWTLKINRATQPFLGLSDKQQGF